MTARTLSPLVGLALGGARWTAPDADAATLGAPVWGPLGLLADLELRLGLPPLRRDPMARLVALRRAAEAAGADAFFARSLLTDPWGTARELGRMLDQLSVEGISLADVRPGAELGRIADLARTFAAPLPPSDADRLARVARALAERPTSPALYQRIAVAEPVAHWPRRWREVFAALAATGTALDDAAPAHAPARLNDLGRVQRALEATGATTAAGAGEPLRGDGSLLFLRAPSPEPLADAVAALIAEAARRGPVVVLRTGEAGALDAALAAHGLPRLGGVRVGGPPLAGAWLPLVLALAREPFDPEAAVDLLLLPDHDLPYPHADRLARAQQDAPGLGGQRWREALDALAAEADATPHTRLATWLARPPSPERPDAPTLAARAQAVAAALEARAAHIRRAYAAGAREAADALGHPAAADALEATREALDAVLRALPKEGEIGVDAIDEALRTFGVIAAHAIVRPEAGPLRRVDAPAALLAAADTIVWWGFADPGRPGRPLFRAAERAALGLPDPIDLVERAATAAREVVFRARERLVLAQAEVVAGQPTAVHPLWSELRGRVGRGALAAIEATPERLLAGAFGGPPSAPHPPLREASAATRWAVGSGVTVREPLSVTALERLLGCPLRHVLEGPATLRERAVGHLSDGPLLLGKLGHRLVETLFGAGELESAGEERVAEVAAALVELEGAVLTRPGRGADRRAALATMTSLVGALRAWAAREGLAFVACESKTALALHDLRLEGRMDLLLARGDGRPVVADLKWSTRSHEQALARRESFQLAAYVVAASADAAPAEGVYFSIMKGEPCGDAGGLGETWGRAQATWPALRDALAAGVLHVSGVASAGPLGAALGVAGGVAVAPERACGYCRMDALCGRAWEA